MKRQSRFFMFQWISDLDFTSKMPVFYFQNLNKYVSLLCIRFLGQTWKSSDLSFFSAYETSFITIQPYS